MQRFWAEMAEGRKQELMNPLISEFPRTSSSCVLPGIYQEKTNSYHKWLNTHCGLWCVYACFVCPQASSCARLRVRRLLSSYVDPHLRVFLTVSVHADVFLPPLVRLKLEWLFVVFVCLGSYSEIPPWAANVMQHTAFMLGWPTCCCCFTLMALGLNATSWIS